MEGQKIQMIHNEFVEYMKANANRLYTEKGYTMEDYNRDYANVEVLPFDLSRFGLSFSEEQLKVINLFFTEERVNRLGHTLLEGHLMNSSEHMVANTLGFDMVTDRGYSGFGKCDENKCVFEFCEGDIYLVLCENMKEYHEELESHCKFYEVEDRLPDLVFVDNRKVAYLQGGDDPGFDEYDMADSSRKLTLASVETAVSAWLSGFKKEGAFAAVTGLDINSDDYKEMLALVESLCEQEFPELHDAVFGDGAGAVDLIFRDRNDSDSYNLYYYNPDSNAGGLIEQCPFRKEDAAEMIGNEDYMDVLASYTHYLSDVDTEHFFNTIFELIEMMRDGFYLGYDVSEVCKGIVGEKTLDDKLVNAVERSGESTSLGSDKSVLPEIGLV